MLGTRSADRAAVIAISAALVLSLLMCLFSGTVFAGSGSGITMKYRSELFDHEQIISVDIIMDEDDWQDMLDNAASEEYYKCDAVINGTTFYSVGIRPKGNTSLSSIVNDPTTDRYSFKLEFDKYIEGQTCFGLDKLVLNNNYADATNMKEAIAYDMFAYLGADSSLYNYARISVNGEYWGVYLALEAVEDSFLLRNYGTQTGSLYKPDSMEMGGGGGGGKKTNDFTPPENNSDDGEFPSPPEAPDNAGQPAESAGTSESSDMADDRRRGGAPGDFGGGGSFGGFGGSGGSDLNYTDDDTDSYSDIWDGEVTSASEASHKRVIKALKAAAEGSDLEAYLDLDNLLRYMAAHEFVVNLDSLSGNMAHNYYLYESGGTINIIPWDYNLSFGGMNGTASSTVNDAIDTPFSGTEFFNAILENEEYLAKYHEYLRILCEEYVNGGVFAETVARIRSQIDELVDTDPNAFYTYDEYGTAVEMLETTVALRAESVLGQLDGSIPSTDAGQQKSSAALVDASAIDLSVMGGMGGGNDRKGGQAQRSNENGADDQSAAAEGSRDDFPGQPPSMDGNLGGRPGGQDNAPPSDQPDSASADNSSGTSSEAGTELSGGSGQDSSGSDSSPDPLTEADGAASADGSGAAQPSDSAPDNAQAPEASAGTTEADDSRGFPGNMGGFPGGGFPGGNGFDGAPGGQGAAESSAQNSNSGTWLLISAGIAAAGILFAALFRRGNK